MDLHINVCSLLSSPFVGGRFFLQNQIQDRRVLASKYDKQDHEHRAEQIGTELAMPKLMSRRSKGTTSRKTPMKKPSVTMEQLSRMGRDGRAERKK